MANVLCVLHDDPVDGYPTSYAQASVQSIEKYLDGMTTPTPSAIDFTPGQLLGRVSGRLGLRKYLEAAGHTLIVTSSKDAPDSVFERELPSAEVVISQPFWPAHLSKELNSQVSPPLFFKRGSVEKLRKDPERVP